MTTIKGEQVRKLSGNVVFKRSDGILYADTVYQYINKQYMEAYGHVSLKSSEGSKITGDTLYYYTVSREAVMKGHARLTSDKTILTAPVLHYNMATGVGYYPAGGKLIDADQTTLTSRYGSFNRNTNISNFRGKVKLVSENGNLETDTLVYNQRTSVAKFISRTTITSPDGVVISDRGTYNTRTETASFDTRTVIKGEAYTLTGDKVRYNKKLQTGKATGNVVLVSVEDEIIITGDKGEFDDAAGYSLVSGHALARQRIEDDTLYLSADTLRSVDNKDSLQRKILAYHNVAIYKTDLQGISDSLVYNFGDSTIRFFKNPILWTEKNQMTADTIKAQLAFNTLQSIYLNKNAFVVSQDSIDNFNQIKGKYMMAHLDSGQITGIDVTGNGESIYFALEEKPGVLPKLMGMNKIRSTDISIRFDSSKIKEIVFITQPEGRFFPAHKIERPETRLKGFSWQIEKRPTLAAVLDRKQLLPETSLLHSDTTKTAFDSLGVDVPTGKTKNRKQRKSKEKETTQSATETESQTDSRTERRQKRREAKQRRRSSQDDTID